MKRAVFFMAVGLSAGISLHPVFADNTFAENAAPSAGEQTGREATVGLELSIGTQGIMSFEEVGVRLPMNGGSFFIDLKARFLSSLTWATFINMQTGKSVSFHPDAVGGVVSFGGACPMLYGILRMYGESDIFLGYSFMPWDSALYGVGNLIGDNLTYAIWGASDVSCSPRRRSPCSWTRAAASRACTATRRIST
jgi:hypothetical protein